ncbi:hypothetical protein C0992_006394 [Termitomyces sp. T32_za158]|nr:hypothetical protein C0992_006394 [Termitomyces sp. T32_za158]
MPVKEPGSSQSPLYTPTPISDKEPPSKRLCAVCMSSRTTNYQHAKHRNKCAERIAKEGHVPSKRTIEHYRYDAVPIQTSLDMVLLPVAKGAYQAKHNRSRQRDKKAWRLEELAAEGLSLISWDGKKSHPLVDKDGRVIALLMGQLQEDADCTLARAGYNVIMGGGSGKSFQQDEIHHHRGIYPVLNVGIMHGQGTIHPINVDNGEHSALANRLLASPDIQRLATFASGMIYHVAISIAP